MCIGGHHLGMPLKGHAQWLSLALPFGRDGGRDKVSLSLPYFGSFEFNVVCWGKKKYVVYIFLNSQRLSVGDGALE